MAITYYQANPELSPDPKVNLSIQVYDRTYFLRPPNACHLFMSQHIDVAKCFDKLPRFIHCKGGLKPLNTLRSDHG